MAVTKVANIAVIAALVLLTLEFGSICQAADSRTPGLFIDRAYSNTTGDQQAPADPTILRSRFVGINWDMMNYPDGTAQSWPGIKFIRGHHP
jgi:hypothetical protein